jgi:AcrR family transcriptional regulator
MARAMTKEAKEEKRKWIIEQAFLLYKDNTFHSFRMEDLANHCNISKGLLFKYFRTKEILFFQMLDQEYTEMFHATKQAFLQHEFITKEVIKETLIGLTYKLFQPTSMLVRLSRIKNIILEQNIDYEYAAHHKISLSEISGQMFMEIEKRLKGVSPKEFQNVFSVNTALLYGFLNSCTTSDVMKQVIKEYNLKQYDIDPIKETVDAFTIYINGYFNLK